MRRLLLLIGGLAGLALLLAGCMALFLAYADLKPMLERWAARETGRAVSVGALRIEWGRRTILEIADLELGNAPWGSRPNMIELGRLYAELDLLSVLRGTLRYENLAIGKLDIILERGPGHVGNWKMGEGGGASGLLVPKDRTQVPTLKELALDDGLLIYRDAEVGLELRIEAGRIDIAAADDEAPINLSMRGAYNGTAATIEVEGQSFSTLRRADIPFETKVTLAGAESVITFQGSLMEPLDFEGVDGAMQARMADLGALLTALDAGIDLPVDALVEGRLKRAGTHWRLEAARGEVAGSSFEGNLTLEEGPRGKPDDFALDLHFARLDLDRLLPARDAKQGFAQMRLDPGGSGKVEIAARLSASEVVYAGMRGNGLEARGNHKQSGTIVESLRVEALGGVLSGNGSTRASERGQRLEASGEIDGLALEEIGRVFRTDTAEIAGRATGLATLQAEGWTIGEALSNLRGHAVFTLSEGRMPRSLVEKVSTNLRSLFRDKAGFSEISCFLGLIEIREGIGRLAPVRLRTADTTVAARGQLDFARGRLDLAIVTDQRGSGFLVLNIPLQVSGSFTNVAIAPLVGSPPPARIADLAALPPASRALAEDSPCLR